LADPNENDLKVIHNIELSDRELYWIGTIVAQWASMEHEIFNQTLLSFEDNAVEELPKAMNNAQFSQVLEIWTKRVVETSKPEARLALLSALKTIGELTPHRNALAHSMWDYDRNDPGKIKAIRIRGKQIISHYFTADDLRDFAMRVGELNFKLRYPGGLEERAETMIAGGGYISRAAIAAFSGHPIAAELIPGFEIPDKPAPEGTTCPTAEFTDAPTAKMPPDSQA